ncbi:hypothetical protein JOF41_003549 [Saccharothrix coeruleofusca]|uniref:Hint domain-containing protein n=1 Tax=Saccharothrix coeruleofusca TaxID=33919 RepID=UPI001AE9CDB1|nr:Hint domain-containing protein [Saccharothrix coeruleofusca]MBP2337371.1 hypothetical protein [Saccharothrix coeruleofusca]
MIAGLVPWGKVGKVLDAGYKAVKAVSSLASIVQKARCVQRRVDSITDEAQRVANESGAKLGGAGESCMAAGHSFVDSTRVLMADGTTKPISEVDIGDKVKATDPATGQTTDREVVGTIIHSDESDMTRLTVRAEDGTTGSVDATSWRPVWSDSEKRFIDIGSLQSEQRLLAADDSSPVVDSVKRYFHLQPVYDLTVEGVHTYYVLAGSAPFMVHNCDEQLDFAHGTTVEHAANIDQNALSGDAARAASHGGRLGQPGNLFTYAISGPGDPNLSNAAQWGVSRNGGARSDAAVVVARMCRCTYNRHVAAGK